MIIGASAMVPLFARRTDSLHRHGGSGAGHAVLRHGADVGRVQAAPTPRPCATRRCSGQRHGGVHQVRPGPNARHSHRPVLGAVIVIVMSLAVNGVWIFRRPWPSCWAPTSAPITAALACIGASAPRSASLAHTPFNVFGYSASSYCTRPSSVHREDGLWITHNKTGTLALKDFGGHRLRPHRLQREVRSSIPFMKALAAFVTFLVTSQSEAKSRPTSQVSGQAPPQPGAHRLRQAEESAHGRLLPGDVRRPT